MKLINAAVMTTKHAYATCLTQLTQACKAIVDLGKHVYGLHSKAMKTNPAYPKAVLSIGKTLILLVIPSASIAAASIPLLAALLETSDQSPPWLWGEEPY